MGLEVTACYKGHAPGRNERRACLECRRENSAATSKQYNSARAAWKRANRVSESASQRRYKGLPDPTHPIPDVCECCGKSQQGKSLALDHCHKSGAFRGWLCTRCNTAIGSLGDSVEGLVLALSYLQRARN